MAMKLIEKIGFIFLVAGLVLFLLAVVTLALIPAMSVNKIDKMAMMPTSIPKAFSSHYDTLEKYHDGIYVGRDIYIKEGCWHCHSQYIRPVSNESLRYGAVSTSGEYQTPLQLPQLLGTRRVGPDLIRESGKKSNDWHLAHLYDPRSVEPLSVMPSYPWYFEKTEEGIKPKQEAIDLVAYLQWLGSWIDDPLSRSYDKNIVHMPPVNQ